MAHGLTKAFSQPSLSQAPWKLLFHLALVLIIVASQLSRQATQHESWNECQRKYYRIEEIRST